MQDLLSGLNEPQRQAVTHVDGPLLVLAGAGSGKTRVITRRVAYLVNQGIYPGNILAITFTNKAAGEMQQRVDALHVPRGALLCTFHALCARLLREFAGDAGLASNYSIYDRDDQLRVVKEAMHRLDFGTSLIRPANALHAISTAKGKLLSPEGLAAQAAGWRDEVVARLYGLYQKLLDQSAALDFDDLLVHCARHLQSHDAFRERWQNRFQFLLIDEYQDTNRAQYLIARALGERHRNVCATGDPDQAIYGWRGATIRNILDFERDYPDARVVKLERNYRSTKVILRAADSVIVHNSQRHERSLWTENEDGAPTRFIVGEDAADEARLVLRAIAARHDDGRPWRHFAIFYRTNAQSRSFEEALVRASVPHRLVGAVQFYSRQEIKDLLAYLRAILNDRDDVALLRIINTPTRGIGKTTVDKLKAWAAESGVSLRAALTNVEHIEALGTRARKAVKAFADLIDAFQLIPRTPVQALCVAVLESSGYMAWLQQPENKERLENIDEFLAKCAGYDEENPNSELADFLQEVSLVSDVDNFDPASDAVTLMTLHAAKGLEFPVVFFTGMEENLLPHANSQGSEDEIEEERRLCYVGMTRAQKELLLTAARQRAQGGSDWEREPSRFLQELDSAVLDEEGREALADFSPAEPWDEPSIFPTTAPKPRPAARAARHPAAAASPFAVGDRVRHPQLGDGRILSVQGAEKLTLVTVAMAAGGKRVFALQYAKLEKL